MFMQAAKIPPPDLSDVACKRTQNLQHPALKRNHWYQIQAIVGATGLVIATFGFYRVRELVAALIVFSVLFGVLGIALLGLFLIQELASKGLAQVEAHLPSVHARHAGGSSQTDGDRVLGGQRWNLR